MHLTFAQAIKSFSKACHLNPSEIELWREDLEWACSLRKKSGEIAKNDASETLKEKTLHIYEMNEAQDCCHANEAIRESLTKSTKPLSIVSETIDATQVGHSLNKQSWIKMKING